MPKHTGESNRVKLTAAAIDNRRLFIYYRLVKKQIGVLVFGLGSLLSIVVLGVVAWFLHSKPQEVLVGLTGRSDSLNMVCKGGIELGLRDTAPIEIRACELQFLGIDRCIVRNYKGPEETIVTPSGRSGVFCIGDKPPTYSFRSDITCTLRVKVPGSIYVWFSWGKLWQSDTLKVHLSSKKLYWISLTLQNRRPEEIKFILAGMIFRDSSFVCQWYPPGPSSIRIAIPFWLTPNKPIPIWFSSDSSKTFRTLKGAGSILLKSYERYPQKKESINYRYSTARTLGAPQMNIIPDSNKIQRFPPSYFTLFNYSLGFISSYWLSDSIQNSIVSERGGVKVFDSRIIREQDSFTLKINSPTRPTPFTVNLGDEILLTGEFTLAARSNLNYIDVRLNGLANSVKINDKEVLPSKLEGLRDTFLALAAIAVGFFAFLGFLGRILFEWPLRGQLQEEPPKTKRTKSKKPTGPKRTSSRKNKQRAAK